MLFTYAHKDYGKFTKNWELHSVSQLFFLLTDVFSVPIYLLYRETKTLLQRQRRRYVIGIVAVALIAVGLLVSTVVLGVKLSS